MEKMVIVKAPESHGKTYTLWELVLKLKAESGWRLIYEEYKDNEPQFVVGALNGKIIGVITFGDPGTIGEVFVCLKKCLTENCDIIFAASRTSGGVYNALKGFAITNNYVTIETSPLYVARFWTFKLDINPLNRLFADMLYKVIYI